MQAWATQVASLWLQLNTTLGELGRIQSLRDVLQVQQSSGVILVVEIVFRKKHLSWELDGHLYSVAWSRCTLRKTQTCL